jgi:hypothetical protein
VRVVNNAAEAASLPALGGALKTLRKNSLATQILTSAAKAAIQNKIVIAALKRCATQNRLADRLFRSL